MRKILINSLVGLMVFWGMLAGLHAATFGFSTVIKLSGMVQAQSADGVRRPLAVGSLIRVGDVITAGPDGQALLQATEGSVLAVRPNSEFVMDAYTAEGNADDKFVLRIVKGALRLVTGLVGQQHKNNVKVITPTAVVGIRGTDYEPFVVTPALAAALGQRAGTYNRVYSGGTTLTAYGTELAVDAGQVGLAPYAPDSKTRALITVLLPVLLDKVPDFYVPGIFDEDLKKLSYSGLASPVNQGDASSSGKTTPSIAFDFDFEGQQNNPLCSARKISTEWLSELDALLKTRDSKGFLALFDQVARISVKLPESKDASKEIVFSPEEFARSTQEAMESLADYSSVRVETRARDISATPSGNCSKLEVQSLVLESGISKGRAFRLRSMESYILERRGERWVATRATVLRR